MLGTWFISEAGFPCLPPPATALPPVLDENAVRGAGRADVNGNAGGGGDSVVARNARQETHVLRCKLMPIILRLAGDNDWQVMIDGGLVGGVGGWGLGCGLRRWGCCHGWWWWLWWDLGLGGGGAGGGFVLLCCGCCSSGVLVLLCCDAFFYAGGRKFRSGSWPVSGETTQEGRSVELFFVFLRLFYFLFSPFFLLAMPCCCFFFLPHCLVSTCFGNVSAVWVLVLIPERSLHSRQLGIVLRYLAFGCSLRCLTPPWPYFRWNYFCLAVCVHRACI